MDADVEKEFLTLMARMKRTHIGQHLVYQINNYVEVRIKTIGNLSWLDAWPVTRRIIHRKNIM